MQYSQGHLKIMVYAEFGGQTECIIGNSKIENYQNVSECGNFDWKLMKHDSFFSFLPFQKRKVVYPAVWDLLTEKCSKLKWIVCWRCS